MVKVAVSPLLSNVKEYLKAQGMDVVDFDDNTITRFGFAGDLRAIVVSGGDMDLLGIENVNLAVPVINAAGRTAEEISMEIERFS
ncbi:MAG: YkuS family protein [Bacillota bacterium]